MLLAFIDIYSSLTYIVTDDYLERLVQKRNDSRWFRTAKGMQVGIVSNTKHLSVGAHQSIHPSIDQSINCSSMPDTLHGNTGCIGNEQRWATKSTSVTLTTMRPWIVNGMQNYSYLSSAEQQEYDWQYTRFEFNINNKYTRNKEILLALPFWKRRFVKISIVKGQSKCIFLSSYVYFDRDTTARMLSLL